MVSLAPRYREKIARVSSYETCSNELPKLNTWVRFPSPAPLALGLVAALTVSTSWGGTDLGFSSSLSQGAVASLSEKFGAEGHARLVQWQKFIAGMRLSAAERDALTETRELEILDAVNAFFNKVPFVEDLKHWRAVDYWASPAETVASNGADCEDFAIAKYFALKEIGIPVAKLGITYVKAMRMDEAHMVLVYSASNSFDRLILDNRDSTIRPASRRPDLIPVYAFNDNERVTKAGSHGSPSQMPMWRALLDRMDKERRG